MPQLPIPADRTASVWSLRALAALFALILAILPACGSGDTDPRPSIVATTGMIADLAGRIGGDGVVVHCLAGPGVDPHLYQPTRGDVRRLRGAELILYNGLELEGRVREALDDLPDSHAVALGEIIDPARLLALHEEAEGHDPHIWLDVELWASVVPTMALEIATLLPEDEREAVRARGDALQRELLDLHQEVVARFAAIPQKRRVLVTAHDAFRYFGRAYGLEVMAVQGVSTESEAGLADVESLVSTIVERELPAIFAETIVPSGYIDAIIEGVEAQNGSIVRGEALFSDALGPAGSGADTYIGMIRHDVDAIASAIAPPEKDGGSGD